ncbi:L,D-transpeptidase [Streptomyces actuosus]|uniref:L,D-transpeptidase n=1 Tax=Streptomyces actuosus TaxID=1885 RepID=A0ABS2VZI6_STRAS|nr:L,D-transpeptidase [Streptomyces actuosus]MBN0048556.1 L,D-transpeptidase [Streptomyces actuosus]
MPEHQSPQPLTEADLSTRLHRLAAHSTAPAPTSGEQVRNRAVRRRRGRRVLLSTSALAGAALTVVATGTFASPTHQVASPATPVLRPLTPGPSPTPVQRVTVDLDAFTLTMEGRSFSITSPDEGCPIGATTVTVTAKHPGVTLPNPYTTSPDDRRWAVTFTDRDHRQRLLIWALDPAAGLNSIGHRSTGGSVALAPEDGKWVYDHIEVGARVEIKGRQAPQAGPDPFCVERQEISVTR